MSTLQHLDDHIIERYTAQPTRLPAELRRQIEHAWQGAPVQLYALADLDQSLRLTVAWLALGPRHIAVAQRESTGWHVRSVERSRIEAIREAPGLSANTLTILGASGEPALALLRYTHRQRRAFENIRFVLEEQIQGHERELVDGDADRLYAESVARPIRDAQALVSGRQTAVIWPLLGYLVRQPAVHVRLRLMSIIGEWVARDLRSELYEHIQRLSLAFFSRKRTGSLITRVSADTDRLWDFLAFGVVDVSLSLVMLAG